jgi:hypothetical protein
MMLTLDKNDFFARFVSCMRGAGLLKNLPEAAGWMLAGKTFLNSPAGFSFSNDFKPAVTSTNNLTSCGIFRGKILQWKTQTNKTASKKGRCQRQTHE